MPSPSSSEETVAPVVESVEQASPAVETPAPEASAPVEDANKASPESPTAKPSVADDKDAKKQPTLAEVLKTAAKIDADGKPSTPAKDESKAAPSDAPAIEKLDGKEDDVPFHTHPRWKAVISERDTLKDQVSKLEPDATQYQKITTFMATHELTAEEVGDGFVLMAMIKAGDPRAVERLDHYRGLMSRVTGDELPKDLIDQVEDGAITEDAAREVSRNRAAVARVNADNAKLRDAETKRNAAQADRNLLVDLQRATDSWVKDISSKDPDFAKKEPVIERFAQALMASRGRPRNRAEATQLMADAYAEVNKTFKAVLPAKQPARGIPTAESSNGAKPVPKSLADVVRLAAAG